MQENWKLYIKSEKEKYKKLGYVKCPAFNNEEVYFNHYGLNHLMYKDGILRTRKEILERFSLLPYASNILKNIKSVDNEEKRIRDKSSAYFWTIKHQIGNHLAIRIILRRLNDGRLHFFSIMKE